MSDFNDFVGFMSTQGSDSGGSNTEPCGCGSGCLTYLFIAIIVVVVILGFI